MHHWTPRALSTLGSPKSESKAVAPSERSYFGIVLLAVGDEILQAEFPTFAEFSGFLYKPDSFSIWVHTCQAIVNIKIKLDELYRSLIKLALSLFSKMLEPEIYTTWWGSSAKQVNLHTINWWPGFRVALFPPQEPEVVSILWSNMKLVEHTLHITTMATCSFWKRHKTPTRVFVRSCPVSKWSLSQVFWNLAEQSKTMRIFPVFCGL